MILYIFIAHQQILENSINKISKMMTDIQYDDYIIVCGGDTTHYSKIQKLLYVKCDDSYCGLPEKINQAFTFIKNNSDFDQFTHFAKLDNTIIIKNLLGNIVDIDYAGFIQGINIDKKYHFNRCANSIWNNKEYTGEVVPYCRGGCGYILSRKAIDKIFPNNEYYNHVYEDIYIGVSLYKVGIYPININIWDFFFDKQHNQKNNQPYVSIDSLSITQSKIESYVLQDKKYDIEKQQFKFDSISKLNNDNFKCLFAITIGKNGKNNFKKIIEKLGKKHFDYLVFES